MQLGDVQARVRIALTTALTNEWSLFAPTTGTSHPSERSIAFHLGWCLRPLVNESWDIDCDYQRSGMELEPSMQFGEGVHRAPDLIVHRRGRIGPEDNLLLIVVTADFVSSAGKVPTIEQVHATQLRFGYRYAVWIDLQLRDDGLEGRVRPVWQWSTLEEGPERSPHPVYSSRELKAITEAIKMLFLG
ncbi:MAG: hypothetical protein LBB58_03420 [Cellulomonadaceae bacterium]|jgi:hypothetical protein|nr:hypothetical protein [Cellulomonadaceae bacterium]